MGVRTVLSGLLTVGVLAGAGYVYVSFVEGRPAFPLTTQCQVTAGSTVRLEAEQMGHAATIAAVGLRRGLPERSVTVALAAALQESKLRNLTGGDRDSLGLFQQRPSQGWGSPEQLNDPRYAADAFYDRLVRVPGWQRMRITEAAQAVQRSAHPEAYQKWADEARTLAEGFSGDSPAVVTCRLSGDGAGSGVTTLKKAIEADWGKLATGEPRPDGAALTVPDRRSGWRLAHWLVSHAAEHGIARVSYDGRQWSADDGDWRRSSHTGDTVIAHFRT